MNQDDLNKETKISILQQELQIWKNTRYQLQIRYRVNIGIENNQGNEQIENELGKCEKAIDILLEEIEKVDRG